MKLFVCKINLTPLESELNEPKCELPKLIIRHNIGPISAAKAIVIGPVSPFASVKCWTNEDGL